jgi:glutathione-regulated potassium-efflux system ancillary protein KefG
MTDPARTLLVFAHPALERARINPAMADAVRDLPGLTFHDLYERYPEFTIDVRLEQKKLLAHDLIVLQYPLYWYATPSLMKEWLDLVWLHGFAYGTNGVAMKGKTLFCAVSTGGAPDAYTKEGYNRHSIEDFLRPMETTARLCGMRWAKPFAIHGAAVIGDKALARETRAYRNRLETLMDKCGLRKAKELAADGEAPKALSAKA